MTATALHPADTQRSVLNGRALSAAQRRERALLFCLCAPAIALTLVVIFIPVGWLSWLSLFDDAGALSPVNYTRLVEQPSYIKTFKATFEVSIAVTAVCVILGYPLTYMLAQLPRRAAGVCMMFVILPFWTSVLVRTYAWLVILQRKGLVNDWLIGLGLIDQPAQLVHNFMGVVIGMSHVLLPFLVLPLYASMKAIDRDYLRAAMNLGAGPAAAFWQVFFPAVAAGARGRDRPDLRALPRILRDAGPDGRRPGDHVGDAHGIDRQPLCQLGRGQRARRRPAAGDAGLPLSLRPAVRRRQLGGKGAAMSDEPTCRFPMRGACGSMASAAPCCCS